MSQMNGNGAPRRAHRLTPEQRRRILEKRRRQRRRRQLMLAIPAALVLIAVAVVGVRFAVGGSRDGKAASPETNSALTLDALTAEDEGASDAQASNLEGGDAAEIPAASAEAATPTPAPQITQEPVNITYQPPGGVFVFDDAYAAAARGEVTGPRVQADLSGVSPDMLSRWPEAEEGYIPVLYDAKNTAEKIVAITVDDCYLSESLRKIVQCALDNGGKLTIFPIGGNLAKDNVASAVKWAWEQGMEIENHSYKHLGTYHYADDNMTRDIWEQSYALNQVLGVNYKQHFFRPKGGDEYKDQRTHAYVSQLGMSGIALWSVVGTGSSLQKIEANLAPGAIYLFHATEDDWANLQQFIPYAVQQGYRLVTLNEMFGLPENETGELSTAPGEKPALQSFEILPATLKKTSYMRAAAVVQQRLGELGYLKGEADGVFGNSSYKATGYFQKAAGIKADGIAGKDTQAAMFADDAPRAK